MEDQRPETLKHINMVRELMHIVIKELKLRAEHHDESKLESPEREIFDEYTPKLKGTTYDSAEYKQYLGEMQVALSHHYAKNRHHPEHYNNGIDGMNLIDIVEMFCDWKAATMRHADGDISKSININQKRFEYPDMIASIFRNTMEVF